jgi:uncharacterized protein (TIGR00661 family)
LKSKNILVAPLNWGIGHAARCIPIINNLLQEGFNPIIASDGSALKFLKKEFPELKCFELPSYNIRYPRNGFWLKVKLASQVFVIRKTIKLERDYVNTLVNSENLIGIISDNRLGVLSNKIPSVYITHQITVMSGLATFIASRVHRYYINKFKECWIPDINSETNLSGKLSKGKLQIKTKYLGLLSRLNFKDLKPKYDLLVLLSGIEPLRSNLENKIISELNNYEGSVFFVRGIRSINKEKEVRENITFCNFLVSNELEEIINSSKLVLSRSGYSTILDLAKLNKKAFFIPTTGQNEQKYLSKYLEDIGTASFATLKNFKIEMLEETANYSGFKKQRIKPFPAELFNLFQRK